MTSSKNYLEFKEAENLLYQAKCVRHKHGFFTIHKGETLIPNKEDMEMKYLMAYIFFHARK
jgi:hypothetical protein